MMSDEELDEILDSVNKEFMGFLETHLDVEAGLREIFNEER